MLNAPKKVENGLSPRFNPENPRYDCVPQIASELITTGKDHKEISIGKAEYRAYLSSVDTYAPNSFFPNRQNLKNAPKFGGQNRTLLVVEDPLKRGYDANRAIFDAATGELFGPTRDTVYTDAVIFAEAMASSLDTEGKTLSKDELLLHADREKFIDEWIPVHFKELAMKGINSSLVDIFGNEINKLFPLPEGFKPFQILAVPSDFRYSVKVEKPSDIIRGLELAWHHNRNANVEEAFKALESISPKLGVAIKIAYQRLYTKRLAQRTMR